MEVWIPDMIYIGSGGVKGHYYTGAIQACYEMGLMENNKGFMGQSVGSIISLLLICEYTPSEINTLACRTNIFSMLSKSNSCLSIEKRGIISMDYIENQLSEMVTEKYGYVPTLSELYKESGLDYVSVSYNISDEKIEHISWRTNPEMPCITAAILSISIPFIFHMSVYNDKIYIDAAMSAPLDLGGYDDGQRRILLIHTEKDNNSVTSKDISMKEIFIRLASSCSSQIKKTNISRMSSACKLITIKTNNSPVLGIFTSSQDRVDMILKGMEAIQKNFQ